MDPTTSMLVSSLVLNAFLLIKDVLLHTKKSKCLGSELEMKEEKPKEDVEEKKV